MATMTNEEALRGARAAADAARQAAEVAQAYANQVAEGAGHAVVLGKPDWSMFVVLNHHPSNQGEAFDPTRTGLDHVGFTVADRDAVVEWEQRLVEKGVTHSPITDHDWGSSLNFRDPDGMQLQIICFAG